jgi:chromosome segregation ATPase
MSYERHSARSENLETAPVERNATLIRNTSANVAASNAISGERAFDFRFQEYVLSRISTTERLANATLRTLRLERKDLDKHEARLRELVASAEDLTRSISTDISALIDTSRENQRSIERTVKTTSEVRAQIDDLHEILNSIAKFQHRLDGLESRLLDLTQTSSLRFSEIESTLNSMRDSFEQRLASFEDDNQRRLGILEARMDPLEIRVAILSSTTLFVRALGRRLKKRFLRF